MHRAALIQVTGYPPNGPGLSRRLARNEFPGLVIRIIGHQVMTFARPQRFTFVLVVVFLASAGTGLG
jgi:hypothetical protein